MAVGNRTRAPDIRLRVAETDVFIEVSSPQPSEAFHDAERVAHQLADAALQATAVGSRSEIYLHVTPDESAVACVLETVRRLSPLGGERVEKGEFANVVVNHSAAERSAVRPRGRGRTADRSSAV